MEKIEEIDAGKIRIEPIPFLEINAMEIIKQVNCHTYITAEGKIEEKEIQNLEFLFVFGTEIVVRKLDKTILFRGLLTELMIEEQGKVFTIKLQASSHTILLDREKKTRPFHNRDRTVQELIQTVTDGCPKAKVIINNKSNMKIDQFMMQYDETDWEFIKRVASHSGQCVLPNSMFDYPAYYVGTPSLSAETEINDNIPYKICKNSRTNDLTYNINVNHTWLELGESLIFRGMELYVKSLRVCLEHAMLNNYYELCSKDELDIAKIFKECLSGKSVIGTVNGINRDQVYISITTIDGNGDGEGCWFPYSTVYASSDGSGWFCMPEIGDKVRVQFPDTDEKNSYAISSVSEYQPNNTSTDRMGDYSKRYIRNKEGMEVMWTPNRVKISSGCCYVDINQNGTLSISADSKLVICSGKDINIDARNQINIYGGGGVCINCGAKAEINMNKDGIVELKGNEIYTN